MMAGLLNNLPVNVMKEIVGPGNIVIASSLSHRGTLPDKYNFPPVLTRKETILHRLVSSIKNEATSFFQTFMDALLLGSSTQEEKNCIACRCF